MQYNDNIKYCGLCSTGTSRIENAKYNTHDKRNIIMTDDLHVPVTSICTVLPSYFNFGVVVSLSVR